MQIYAEGNENLLNATIHFEELPVEISKTEITLNNANTYNYSFTINSTEETEGYCYIAIYDYLDDLIAVKKSTLIPNVSHIITDTITKNRGFCLGFNFIQQI